MLTLLAGVHIAIGLLLVLFVLLQDPKGGAMGVFSGGSSANSFFGSSGASNFLTTTTRWLAILFAVSCLTLTYYTAKRGGSVMDNLGLPATPPAAQPSDTPAPGQQSIPGTNPALDKAADEKPAEAPKQ
jgi:preprotein translocase subunit SecG